MSKDRFKDALWFDKSTSILVGGSGGIGSWFSFFAAKAGFDVATVDFDVVEEHNLGGQLFLTEDVGNLKVNALSNVVSLFSDADYNLTCSNTKIIKDMTIQWLIPNYRYCDIVFVVSAFDNMEARENLFDCTLDFCKNYPNKICYFIDGRLLMEQMRIYCVDMANIKQVVDYKVNNIFPDSDVEDIACTMKQVSHGAAMIATHMIGFITNIISNKLFWNENVFKVPYMWDYIIPMNKIEEHYEPTL